MEHSYDGESSVSSESQTKEREDQLTTTTTRYGDQLLWVLLKISDIRPAGYQIQYARLYRISFFLPIFEIHFSTRI